MSLILQSVFQLKVVPGVLPAALKHCYVLFLLREKSPSGNLSVSSLLLFIYSESVSPGADDGGMEHRERARCQLQPVPERREPGFACASKCFAEESGAPPRRQGKHCSQVEPKRPCRRQGKMQGSFTGIYCTIYSSSPRHLAPLFYH